MTTKQPTHLVVDGSNIATEGRSAPSLEQLDEAVRAILDEFPHDGLTVVVDATFGHRIADDERPAYEEAILAGEIVAPPAGAIGRGDAFILQVAAKANATVFSNDSFQEFHGEHEWLFEEGRLIGGKPVPGIGWVFVARVPVRGPLSRRAVRDSRRGRTTTATPRTSRRSTPASTTPLPRPEEIPPPPTPRRTRGASPVRTPAAAAPAESARSAAPASAGPPSSPDGAEALNQPTVFLRFISKNRIGSVIEATVDHFSSHGAYVVADGARCYLPTKTMGDPPPKRARDIIDRDDVVRVEVQSLDAERRGINVRFVELLERSAAADTSLEATGVDEGDGGEDEPLEDEAAYPPAQLPRSVTDVPVKKAATATRKAARKAPSGRPVKEGEVAPTKKAAAEATPSPRAAKAAARKAPAKKATRRTAASAEPVESPAADETPVKATRKRAATKRAAATEDVTPAPARRTTKRAAKATTTPTPEEPAVKAPAKRTARATKAAATDASAEPVKKATRRSTKAAAEVPVAPESTPAKKATARKASSRKAAAAATSEAAETPAPATKRAARATKATAEKATAAKATTRKAASRRTSTAAAPETPVEATVKKSTARRGRRTAE